MNDAYACSNLPFTSNRGGLEVFGSARGLHQGYNLGSLCYGALFAIVQAQQGYQKSSGLIGRCLERFRFRLPTMTSRPFVHQSSLSMWQLQQKATKRLMECLRVKDISPNCRKKQALLADGVGRKHLSKEQASAMDNTWLTVVRQGMSVVAVLVRT